MGRGKIWTEEENELLLKMFGEGKSPQEIYDIGAFPERTVYAIMKQLQRLGINSFVQTKNSAIVQRNQTPHKSMVKCPVKCTENVQFTHSSKSW